MGSGLSTLSRTDHVDANLDSTSDAGSIPARSTNRIRNQIMKKLLLLSLLLASCTINIKDVEVAIAGCMEANSTLDEIMVGSEAHTVYCANGFQFTIRNGKIKK